MSACPHSCAQHHIGDIGLQGGLARINGAKAETADLLLGGALGDGAQLARKIALKVPWTELPDRLTQLVSAYKERRADSQSFNNWIGLHTDDELRAYLGFEHEEAVGDGSGVWDGDDGWNRPARAAKTTQTPAE
jgi:sulfite reductase beta subunit-like hemoprotein